MLKAILNKYWRQHPTRHQLYGHLRPITKTIQVRPTRHTGHCWRSKDELISDVLPWTPAYGQAKAGRPARTYVQQLCEDMGCNPEDEPESMNDSERGSGISMLAGRHDDDDFEPCQKLTIGTLKEILCKHQHVKQSDMKDKFNRSKSKVGDRSRGRTEGSLFNSYYTKV